MRPLILFAKFSIAIFCNCVVVIKSVNICHNRTNEYVGIIENIKYAVVPVNSEIKEVNLECRFCDQIISIKKASWNRLELKNTDNGTKLIIKTIDKKDKYLKVDKQLKVLEFRKFSDNYTGLYSCAIPRININITYFLSVVQTNATLNGTVSQWLKYKHEKVLRVKTKVNEESLDDQLGDVVYTWAPWSECHCGVTKFHAKKYRYGYCLAIVNDTAPTFNNSLLLPCRSRQLASLYPYFNGFIKHLKNFYETHMCAFDDPCRKNKTASNLRYLYKLSVVAKEKAHLKFLCPHERHLLEKQHFEWIIRGKMIKNSSAYALGLENADERVGIDTEGTLYINGAMLNESGKYGCLIDGVPIKMYKLVVEPVSMVISKEFLHCILVITYCLLFCFIVYCILLPVQYAKKIEKEKDDNVQLPPFSRPPSQTNFEPETNETEPLLPQTNKEENSKTEDLEPRNNLKTIM